MSRPTRFAAAAVLLVFLVPSAALGADRLGEPWEEAILDGIGRQEQDRKEKRPETILRQAELRAARGGDAVSKVVRLYLLGRAYGIAGDLRSAQATYREVLQLAPKCYFAYHDLGMLALQQSPPDKKGAEHLLRRAVTVHPGYVMGHKKLVSLLLEIGRKEEAVRVLEQLVTLEPSGMDTRFLLARTLLELGKLDRAEREIVVLIRKDSKSPAVQDLKASLYLAKGRLDKAKKVYRRLAEQNPTAARPLRAYLGCLEQQRAKSPESLDPEEWIWVLERLYRAERNPETKQKLRDALEEFRRMKTGEARPTPEGPPSDERLAQVLDHAPVEGRLEVLKFVYARSEEVQKSLMTAIVKHLGSQVEPSPQVRQWCLRVMGRYAGPGFAGLIRHSLGDVDASVRPVAVDAMVAMSENDDLARSAAFLALGLYRDSRDPVLAGQARYAVLDLAKGRLPDDVADTEDARRDAFEAWWRGTVATEAKIDALLLFPKVRDHFPEDILVQYLMDENARVAEGAWRALGRSAAMLRAAKMLKDARAEWFGRLPAFQEGALTGADAARTRAMLRAWTAARPN